jgi:hypothetical protein
MRASSMCGSASESTQSLAKGRLQRALQRWLVSHIARDLPNAFVGSGESERLHDGSPIRCPDHEQPPFGVGLGRFVIGGVVPPRACERALSIRSRSYRTIQSILKTGMDRQALLPPAPDEAAPVRHDNIRGPHHYS